MHTYNITQQKDTDKQTDPLDNILNCIRNNPTAYANRHTHNSNNNLPKTENEHQTKISNKEGGRITGKKQQTRQRTLTQYNKAVKVYKKITGKNNKHTRGH